MRRRPLFVSLTLFRIVRPKGNPTPLSLSIRTLRYQGTRQAMMNFSDMKISTRLSAGFGVLVLLIALMGGTSMVKLHSVEDSVHAVVND
jgi:hypothetical protein